MLICSCALLSAHSITWHAKNTGRASWQASGLLAANSYQKNRKNIVHQDIIPYIDIYIVTDLRTYDSGQWILLRTNKNNIII